MTRISVALATYNGEPWIERQLASVAGQTRRPDELVVADDGSTDRTVELVREAWRATEIPLVLVDAHSRLGALHNFERAIGACTGDVIALCDQDDEWCADKLAVIERAFDVHPATMGVFSDGTVIDADGSPTGTTLWQSLGFDAHDQSLWAAGDALDVELRYNVVVGATLAFRASVLREALPFPGSGWHDYWIALLLTAHDSLMPLDKQLIRYRLHDANAAGLAEQRSLADRIARVEQTANLRGVVEQCDALRTRLAGSASLVTHALERIGERQTHLTSRLTLPTARHRRLLPVLREARTGRYQRYSQGWRSIALDLLGRPAPVRDRPVGRA